MSIQALRANLAHAREEKYEFAIGLQADEVEVALAEFETKLAEANERAEANYHRMPRRGELGAAIQRAEQAESQLAEATAKLKGAAIHVQTSDSQGLHWAQRAVAAEAHVGGLRATLEKVEAWMASEDGPIHYLWENLDICDYDSGDCTWDETLDQVRDFNVPAESLGYGVEWPVVALYREILQVIKPAAQPAESRLLAALEIYAKPENWYRTKIDDECRQYFDIYEEDGRTLDGWVIAQDALQAAAARPDCGHPFRVGDVCPTCVAADAERETP